MKRIGLLLVLAATNAHGFVRSKTSSQVPIKWTTNCIDYKLNQAGSVDLDLERVEDAVVDSFNQWQEPNCSDLRLNYTGRTADTEAGFRPGGTNRNIIVWRDADDSWEHQRDIIAVTTVTFCTEAGSGCPFVGAILDADIELNGEQFTFTDTQVAALTRFDVRNTVTHEAGHFLGLDHTSVGQATMFASAPPGERSKASLHADDIEGICAVYPSRSSGPVCIASQGSAASEDDGCQQGPGQAPGGAALLLGLLLLRLRRIRRPQV